MTEHTTQTWRELCIAAAFEENPEKLPQIVAQINSRLVERQQQLADDIFECFGGNPAPGLSGKRWLQ